MRISVYITSYNQKEYLKEAIESVINQTLKPFEIIIVDDCSSDGSQDLINSYTSLHSNWIKSIMNSSNHGISYCRTKAINAATGEFLTWVDGDDYFMPQKLEKESQLLVNSEYQVAFSNYYCAENELDNLIRVWAYDFNKLPNPGKMFKEVISRDFPWGSLYRSELIEINALRETGLYDEKLKIYEDYDLRVRLSMKCNITYTNEPLSIYRLHKAGISRSNQSIHYDSIKYIFNKYRKQIEGLPEKDKQYVKDRIKLLLEEKDPDIISANQSLYQISLKRKVQLKLISLINRF